MEIRKSKIMRRQRVTGLPLAGQKALITGANSGIGKAVAIAMADAAAAQAWLEPVADHLADAALGHVSEIFDGDPPHTPRGAPAQAWSTACVLEAWWRLGNRANRAGALRQNPA
jgi:NAD(P)-dependent dehydrogenase (short-subunit alcohol dehydrogenase family)